MGKIGAGLGTFEMIGKTVSFAPLYNGMASIAAQLAKGKAEAEKQRRKSEEEAMAKVDDFIISDKNNYTQKYLPFATGAMSSLIERVNEDKQKYPNTWTNRIGQHILQTKNELNWALEQSSTQRNIEKSAQEGYMVPEPLLQAYKSNYGDVSDIQSLSPTLSEYNISVSENGAISANLVKPVDLMDEFGKFKNNRALFMEPTLEYKREVSPAGVKYDITKQKAAMDPASVAVFTRETVNNPGLRVSYMASPEKKVEIADQMSVLSKTPGFDKIDPVQLREIALTRVIQSDIDKLDKNKVDIVSQREAKGLTINTGDKPQYINPDNVFFEEKSQFTSSTPVATFTEAGQKTPSEKQSLINLKKNIELGGGSHTITKNGETFVYKMDNSGNVKKYKVESGTIYGFDARQVWEKQSDKEQFKSVPISMISNKNLYSPDTKEKLGDSRRNEIIKTFPGGLISSYMYINGKVYANVAYEIPSSRGVGMPDVNNFLVEVTRGDNFDVLGRNLASSKENKYNSMYDYFSKKVTTTDPWDAATY